MDLPRIWRLKSQRYKLEGSQCKSCQKLSFPPVQVCSDCRSQEIEPFRFAGKGSVYSFSTVYNPLTQFTEFVPYVVALIDLAEGPRITAQLTDVKPEDVSIGMKVEMVIRKISEQSDKGAIVYGYKFRPPIK
ncbi:MAG: Zn-ribbon domain-containing OB-fold protein [Gammaproteobacteria bacterium]|nr:Zn-ribbon domain-containing OB-fold protein [Gammaproteobacteria bacterium]